MPPRKIIHIDMDAFYASVEQRDFPEYRDQPVIVGGSPEKRGVVATASYEARKYGVHSAMPTSTAKRLCPHGIFVPPRFEVYEDVSAQIMAVCREYTDLIEPVSLDEAYLDVTVNKPGIRFASTIARAIKRDIRAATGLTASAGVGPNMLIAKIASDMHKPDGLTVVPPEQVADLLRDLPVGKIPGIGHVTERRMAAMGIKTAGDLAQRPLDELVSTFGKVGLWYYSAARGQDDRQVEPDQVRKSIGAETTYPKDLNNLRDITDALEELANTVAERLEAENVSGRTVVLKITYANFEKITRRKSLDFYFRDAATILGAMDGLLAQTEAGRRPLRLLGITVANLDNIPPGYPATRQLNFPF